MKKFSIFTLVFVLTLSLAACGRRNHDETSVPSTTVPSTGMDIIPDMEPIETNIPDPNVDSSMPMYTESTDTTDTTTDGTGRNGLGSANSGNGTGIGNSMP